MAVLDVRNPERPVLLGRIPTAWYPTAVEVSADGKTLYILNAKGRGRRPRAGRLHRAAVQGAAGELARQRGQQLHLRHRAAGGPCGDEARQPGRPREQLHHRPQGGRPDRPGRRRGVAQDQARLLHPQGEQDVRRDARKPGAPRPVRQPHLQGQRRRLVRERAVHRGGEEPAGARVEIRRRRELLQRRGGERRRAPVRRVGHGQRLRREDAREQGGTEPAHEQEHGPGGLPGVRLHLQQRGAQRRDVQGLRGADPHHRHRHRGAARPRC